VPERLFAASAFAKTPSHRAPLSST
jgi:hypothetical protein